MSFGVKLYEAAILFGVAVFLLSTSPQKSEVAASAKESVVEAAQKLALSGQRRRGQDKLLQAIKAISGETSEKAQMIGALNQLSRAFFGERSQAVFELGESHYFSGKPTEALARYQEALELEPENIRIMAALARTQIALGACEEAKVLAVGGLAMNPFDQDLRVFQLRGEACAVIPPERREAWDRELSQLESALPLEASWLRAMADDLAGNREAVITGARKISKIDPEFPEANYLLWKYTTPPTAKRSWAANYISLCKKSDQTRRRRYKNEPKLCGWLKTVEEAQDKGAE